jgi:hypothetical protein
MLLTGWYRGIPCRRINFRSERMARPPKTRHSKTRKDPVTIELEPDAVARVEEKDSPQAEPVKPSIAEEAEQAEAPTGAEANQLDAETDTLEWGPAPTAEPQPEEERRFFEDETAGRYRSFENTTDLGRNESQEKPEGTAETAEARPEPSPSGSQRGFSNLAAGLVGGLIALIGAGALQVAGILPTAGGNGSGEAVSAVQSEMAAVREQISTLQADGSDGAGVQQALEEARGRLDGLAAALDQTKTQLADLRSAAQSGGAENSALDALNARLAEIEKSMVAVRESGAPPAADLTALGERLSAVESAAKGAANAASAADGRLANLEQRLGGLQQSVANLSNAVKAQAAQPKVALSVAVSALKAAVDEGGTFTSELEAFAAAAPDAPELAELRTLAEKGVPSRAEIAAAAPTAAQAMVDADRLVSENAGLVERLLSSARSLVKIRPVGPVEGAGVPETVARMEAAIKDGDLARAVAEYDTLPEGAKAAGRELADKIRARLSAEQLVEKAAAGALKAA